MGNWTVKGSVIFHTMEDNSAQ